MHPLGSKTLEGDFLHERIERDAAVLPSVAAGGQRMVSAGSVVAHCLGRKVAQKFKIVWLEILPLAEIPKAKNGKIISFREKQLSRGFGLESK